MNKSQKELKKSKKKEKKIKRQENRGTIAVYAQYTCGCCIAEMRFKDKESAEQAFLKAGVGNKMNITDDKGVVHEGIDTFYGFSTDEKHKFGFGFY
jgi:hypothetical protein